MFVFVYVCLAASQSARANNIWGYNHTYIDNIQANKKLTYIQTYIQTNQGRQAASQTYRQTASHTYIHTMT